jgi:5-methyltetrahydropteroyltriglutamate--homocysteine methyltransferase
MANTEKRILTTHVGSLPRPDDAVALILKKERKEPYDSAEFDRVMKRAVADIVDQQIAVGIDVVSDGEASKIGYSTYVKDRYTGFGGEYQVRPHLDVKDFPEFRKRMAAFLGPPTYRRETAIGPITLKDDAPLKADLANFKAATAGKKISGAFMTAASPGIVASFLQNKYFPTHEAYIESLASAMKSEYEAIVAAGFTLQIDCPDFAMSRHTGYQDLTEEQFLKRVAFHVDTLNGMLANIPAEKARIHLCWGNYEGPHDHDIAVEKLLPIIRKIKAKAISYEAANPRHEHEWIHWRDAKLPDDVILIPGVIDSSTNYVEHPELVAQRLERLANAVGKDRVWAGTDCGFGTFAGYSKVDPGIAWKKFRAMVEGAEIASKRLWK